MYTEYFGFREPPFSITPDPRFLYMSVQHREALAHLMYGLQTEGGFVLLTGEVGTGKTTICRRLFDQVPDNVNIAFVINPKISSEELLATICDELGIAYPLGNSSVKVFVDRINEYLLEAYAKGRKTILILEEAQNLLPEVLEQVRLLTNLETDRQKLLQIIMIGQPELREILLRPEMSQLSQRVTARYHMGPLAKQELSAYVNHRLSVAGVNRRVFSGSAISKLYRVSRGIPRLVNVICDRALLGTYVEGKNSVDRKTLVKAAREVLGKSETANAGQKRLRFAIAVLVLIICGVALSAAYYSRTARTTVFRTTAESETKAREMAIRDIAALNWPDNLPIDDSKNMAYQALYREWDISYLEKENADGCANTETYGLHCYEGKGSLQDLIKLNRPSVLKLSNAEGNNFYATLKGIQNGRAILILGSENVAVDFQEIAKRWAGEYFLLWRAPGNYQGNMRPGENNGPAVEWLENQLSIIQKQEVRSRKPGIYDDELVNEVKKFQVSDGLVPDGIVGTQTIIHMHNKMGSNEPRLTVARGV
jgi:general secretion pathway protein A